MNLKKYIVFSVSLLASWLLTVLGKLKFFSSQQINLLEGYLGPEREDTQQCLWNGDIGPDPAGH